MADQVIKTRHKAKNFKQTKMMMREGLLVNGSYIQAESAFTIALLKTRIDELLKPLKTSNQKVIQGYLFHNLQLTLQQEQIFLKHFECLAELNQDEKDWLASIQMRDIPFEEKVKLTQEVYDGLMKTSRKHIQRFKEKGLFDNLKNKKFQ